MQVATYERRSINACEYGCLSCGALRQPFYAHSRVGRGHKSVKGQSHLFALKQTEEVRFYSIERVMLAARAYTETINEDQ